MPFYDNYIDMLDSGDVDAIITCVPHYQHPEMGIEALKRDIHALLEKPTGVYTKQVRELNEFAATKPALTFGIMFNQRANELYQKVKEIIDNDEIGAIRRTNWVNGVTGLFFATNTNATNSSVEFQVLLEKGKLTIKDSVLTVTNGEDKKVEVIEDSKLPGSKSYYGASHSTLINHFYTCLENDTNDYIHAKDAQPSMEMIRAIRRSSEIKKEINMEVYQL